jgi:hypothetical protein
MLPIVFFRVDINVYTQKLMRIVVMNGCIKSRLKFRFVCAVNPLCVFVFVRVQMNLSSNASKILMNISGENT